MTERRKPKPKRFKIDEGTYILDTSGARTRDEDAMKRQADYSYQLVKKAFEIGALRIATEDEPSRDDDQSSSDESQTKSD